MESTAIATENLRNTMATVEAMKLANKEMKKHYGKVDIDKIEVRRAMVSRALGTHSLHDRICIMTWRTCWSKPTRYRNL